MPRHEIVLPNLGIDQPILSLWLVKRGSRLAEGDQMLEVLAGGVTVDLPTPVEGILSETLAAEGESITVGQRLAVIESDF
jgi:pyruvate/2-oxoglutarate dehydrogenase complex dihydrolipoamide acyltransferase (E2) component